MPTKTYADLVHAAQGCLEAIRRNWPAIPARIPVVITSRGNRKDMLGWTQHGCWTERTAKEERSLPEIGLSAEYLAHRSPRLVFETLLHEAVHAYCGAKGLQDTSRRGQYHNRVFAETAKAFGLVVEAHARIGHTTPDITEPCRVLYKKEIAALGKAMRFYRNEEPAAGPGGRGGRDRNLMVGVCSACGAKIRASARTFDLAPVFHGDGGAFEPIE